MRDDRGGSGALVFLSVVVLALGGVAWLHLDVWTTWAEQQRAEASGERVDGVVTDLRSSTAPRTADQFRVEAAVDGTDVVAYVDEATHDLLDVGDPVALAAIPGPANEYVVVGDDDPGTALAVLTLVDVVLVVLVVVAVVRLRRRLAGDATPAR